MVSLKSSNDSNSGRYSIGPIAYLNWALPQDYWHLFIHLSPRSPKELRAVELIYLESAGGSGAGGAKS